MVTNRSHHTAYKPERSIEHSAHGRAHILMPISRSTAGHSAMKSWN